jgi:hypothetical protein
MLVFVNTFHMHHRRYAICPACVQVAETRRESALSSYVHDQLEYSKLWKVLELANKLDALLQVLPVCTASVYCQCVLPVCTASVYCQCVLPVCTASVYCQCVLPVCTASSACLSRWCTQQKA